MKKITLLLTSVMATLLLFSGMALAATITCQAGVECFGTNNADTLKGTADVDHMYGRGGGDTLKGFGEYDSMYGQGGDDKLFGGPGSDQLVGGSGNDTLSGGDASGDDYYFGTYWGHDSIDDSAAPNAVQFRNGPSGSAHVTENLTIDLVAGDGPEVTNASDTDTINWDTNVVSAVSSGDGDDEITGNGLGNSIIGGRGTDTISSGAGNDVIFVNDGEADHVDCGSNTIIVTDHDTVIYDSSDLLSDNCEEKILQNP